MSCGGRLQIHLKSHVAVAVVEASDCSSDATPSLGISICRGCGAKKKERKKKRCLGWALTQEDWYPYLEDTWTDRHRGTTMRKQREKSPLTREGQRPQKEPTLDLGLLVPRIVRK